MLEISTCHLSICLENALKIRENTADCYIITILEGIEIIFKNQKSAKLATLAILNYGADHCSRRSRDWYLIEINEHLELSNCKIILPTKNGTLNQECWCFWFSRSFSGYRVYSKKPHRGNAPVKNYNIDSPTRSTSCLVVRLSVLFNLYFIWHNLFSSGWWMV